MTVKELKEKLNEYSDSLEIAAICDRNYDIEALLSDVEYSKCSTLDGADFYYDNDRNKKFTILNVYKKVKAKKECPFEDCPNKIKIKGIRYFKNIPDISYIEFSNGTYITTDHLNECCERNYADFSVLEDTDIYEQEFTLPLTFESAGNYGFSFGNKGKMYFVPCYSEQSGKYSNKLNICYGDKYSNKLELTIECEIRNNKEKCNNTK